MNYNNFNFKPSLDIQTSASSYEQETNECISKGICSISPALFFLHETIISYLKELAFYLLKLKELGISNEKIKENIIEVVSGLVVGVEYNEEMFSSIITRLYGDLIQAKELYTATYKKNEINPEFLKSKIKAPKNITISNAIKQGQKLFNTKFEKLSNEQKNALELLFNVVKSICVHFVELKDLNVDRDEAYEAILSLLSTMNKAPSSEKKIESIVENFVALDHELLMDLHMNRENKFGLIAPTEVLTSTRVNKAILVSGTNLVDLENLLEATKNQQIDIYTHGHLIMAHSFQKFKAYPNLVGHFGQGIEHSLLDFAKFPGPIFLTKHSFQKVEKLYRSSIYTTDVIASKGVGLIKHNNFEPLIQAALHAKGFTEGIEKSPIKINLDEIGVIKKITEIAEKIKEGTIKNLIFIGVSNHTKTQKEYFERFLKLLGEDSFVISFSYKNGKNNILLIESDYGFPLLYKAFDILSQKVNLADLNTIMCSTRCEIHTISTIIYLKKHLGIKKIYFADCSPNLFNPALIDMFRKLLDLKKYTTPEADFREMTQSEE